MSKQGDSPFSRPRLRPLATLAAAGAASVTGSHAAIVFINAGNALIADANTTDGAYFSFPLDLNSDGTTDIQLWHRQDSTQNNAAVLVAPPGGSVGVVGSVRAGLLYPSRIPAGALIDASAAFLNLTLPAGTATIGWLAEEGGFAGSQWITAPNNTGYAGIQFRIGTNVHYGWLRMTVNSNTATRARAITLHEYAYETTPGEGIITGQLPVPEPSGLGLLALGSLGLASMRQRKKTP